MTAFINRYRKTIVAVVGVAVGVLTQVLGADSEWVTLTVALATALGVYATPNKAA